MTSDQLATAVQCTQGVNYCALETFLLDKSLTFSDIVTLLSKIVIMEDNILTYPDMFKHIISSFDAVLAAENMDPHKHASTITKIEAIRARLIRVGALNI